MKLGIDFDNTIVSYDSLFYKVALEQSLIPKDIEPSKTHVRDYLREAGKENIWTEMQGYVYGARMDEAEAFPGVIKFMQWANNLGIELAIISHKTKHPFIGKQYDLHAAALGWIEKHLTHDKDKCIKQDNIYFELTKDLKIKRVGEIACDIFVDDLPEILLATEFPKNTNKLLFDPLLCHQSLPDIYSVRSWEEIQCLFQQKLVPKI